MGNRKEISNGFDLLLKTPPHLVEAEKAVLGAMLLDKEALEKILDHNLDSHDFYIELHQRIYDIMIGLYNQQKPVDMLSVTDAIKTSKLPSTDKTNAAAYLVALINTVTTSANVDYYAQLVKDKSMLRKIIRVGNNLIESSYDAHEPVEKILDTAEENVLEIRAKKKTEFFHVKDLVSSTLDRLEMAVRNKKEVTGIPTGFTEFDTMTSGLQPANLIIIAGRPSMGKTAFTMNIAEHAAIEHKKAVAIFSLEMSKEELMLRFMCARGRINSLQAKKGYLKEREWPVLTTVGQVISESQLYVNDASSGDILEIKSKTRKLYKELARGGSQLSLVIIDYLQLMHASGRYESRQQEISSISRGLKRMAMELNVPIIAVSQLSRRPEEKGREGRPQLSDLRESGAIEQDADLVAFIYREFYYKKDIPEDEKKKAKIHIMKQRNGPTGDIELIFLSEYTRFDNYDKAHSL